MKAIYINKSHKLEYGEVPVLKAKKGEVLIKVIASALNHLDLHLAKGVLDIPLPHIPGSDVAGIKRAILTKFIDKIVADQEYMSVSGYIPFPLRKEVQNVEFKPECGHKQRKNSYLQFHFSFHPPNPRKERIIVERDRLGRIIHSQPPQFKF